MQSVNILLTYRSDEGRTQSVINVANCLQHTWGMKKGRMQEKISGLKLPLHL